MKGLCPAPKATRLLSIALEPASPRDAGNCFRRFQLDFCAFLWTGLPSPGARSNAISLWLTPTNLKSPPIPHSLKDKISLVPFYDLFLYWLKHHTRHIVLLQMTTALRIYFLFSRWLFMGHLAWMMTLRSANEGGILCSPIRIPHILQAGRNLQKAQRSITDPRSYYDP